MEEVCSSIDKKYMNVLVNYKTLATMWLCLIIVHEQNLRENKHIMQQGFFEFQMRPSQDMSSFIALMQFANDWHVISAWDSIPKAVKTFQSLIVRLLKEDTFTSFL